nr:transposase [Glutamicibacter sp. HZAU]
MSRGEQCPDPLSLTRRDPLAASSSKGIFLCARLGLAPTTRQSGISIKSERVSHTGNKRLKRALFLSALASIRSDPTSCDYYDRKRGQRKRRNQAFIALAHRRLTVLFAMIRDGSLYDVPELKIT